jgi:hypothetical protein
MQEWILILGATGLYLVTAHYLSYSVLKQRIVKQKSWDLNICCGKTDGGGLNVDIFQHQDLPNFQHISCIYNLPFTDQAFETVLCSHTIEHVDNPHAFYDELKRVGKEVTLVVPPLYDLAAVFNLLEHKWIFLTFRKKHHSLPKHIRLPFTQSLHKRFGQRNHA